MKVICEDIFGKVHEIDKSSLIQRPSAYGIYIKNNQILLVQNAFNFKWELPGGGFDKGETKMEGLAREFKEETGLNIGKEVKEIDFKHNYFYDLYTNGGEGWECYRSYFLIATAEGKLIHGNGDDIKDAKYFEKDKLIVLANKDLLNNINKKMLGEIIKYLN